MHHLVQLLLELVEVEWPVVKGRGKAEAVIH